MPRVKEDIELRDLHWECACGKVIVEQIGEVELGGTTKVLEDIDKSLGRAPQDPEEHDRSYGLSCRNIFFAGSVRILNIWSHVGHSLVVGAADPSAQCTRPTINSEDILASPKPPIIKLHRSSSVHSSSRASTSSDERFSGASITSSNASRTLSDSHASIHLYIKTYASRLRLKTMDISNFPTDGQMFSAIHEAYFGLGLWRRLRRTFSLSSLSSVKFVHFNVNKHNQVTIDRGGHQRCPPPAEYLYAPNPPPSTGLIPPKLLYEYIANPSFAYGHTDCWRKRMPRYTAAELRCPINEPFIPGYGLHFIETLSWSKVSVVMAASTILSFTFSGLWVCSHSGAIQDGFAMGGCFLSVTTIGLGLIQGLDAFWGDRSRS